MIVMITLLLLGKHNPSLYQGLHYIEVPMYEKEP